MGEILTALVMIGIALGPFPKHKSINSFNQTLEISKFQNTRFTAENILYTTVPGIKKATLTKNGLTKTAYYNWHNEQVATTQSVEITELTPAAIKNLITCFPGYQMGEITKYTSTDVYYFVNLKNDRENFIVKITPDAQVSYLKPIEPTIKTL